MNQSPASEVPVTKLAEPPQDSAAEPRVTRKRSGSYSLFPTRRFAILFGIPLPFLVLAPLLPFVKPLALVINLTLIALLVVDYLRSGIAEHLIVKRRLLQRLSLGVENDIALHISHLGHRKARLKLFDDPPSTFTIKNAVFDLELEPNEERTVRYVVIPHRRGNYRFLNIHIEILGPWGLSRRIFHIEAETSVKVYPNLKGVEQWKLLTQKRHLAEIGVHKIRKRGSGMEFEHLRLYNRDDEYRSINWKATARRLKPVTSVYQTERSQSVVVLLDAGRRMAAWVGGLSKLDYAINASLLLAYVASMGDDNISLGVFNSELKTYLAPKKGRMQYRRFMEKLYACEADLVFTNYRRSFIQVTQKIKKRSLIVIMTDVLDPDGAAELERAVSIFRPRHLPLIVSLRDPSLERVAQREPLNIHEVFESVVAQEVFLDRKRMTKDIRRRGVHTIDALPDDFTIAVVNEYLRLKARNEL